MTQGKQLVVIIGQPKAMGMAVRNACSMRRLTHLADRIRRVGEGAAGS